MASDPPGSSPSSSKSDTPPPTKEDAETTATRKELRNTSISEPSTDALRTSTPDISEDNVTSKDKVLSPKKKRAHDQVDDGSAAATKHLNGREQSLEPEKKRQRDELAPDKGQGGLSGTKSHSASLSETTESAPKPGPSLSAPGEEGKSETVLSTKPTLSFVNSSLSGFAAAASPFSTLGSSSKGSIFGSAATKEPSAVPLAQKPTLNFSQASGASPFSGMASGGTTAGFGSSFGSPLGGGGTLSSFAKPGESLTRETKQRAFGAPDSDVEGYSEDEDSDNKPSSEDGETDEKGEAGKEEAQVSADDKKKPKLQKVAVNTGEAGEATIVQVRAKMYYVDNDNKEAGWRERGAGTLKINVPASCVDFDDSGNAISGTFDASGLDEDNGSGAFNGARLIMRQDQTHRLLLNTVLLPAMTFQEKTSLKAVNVLFTAFSPNEEGDTPRASSVNMKMSPANAKLFLNELGLVQRELQSA